MDEKSEALENYRTSCAEWARHSAEWQKWLDKTQSELARGCLHPRDLITIRLDYPGRGLCRRFEACGVCHKARLLGTCRPPLLNAENGPWVVYFTEYGERYPWMADKGSRWPHDYPVEGHYAGGNNG